MGSTFIQLTNRLLRRLNEVELTENNFNTVIGLQSTVKDAIVDSIREIHSKIPVLDQTAFEHTQVLSVNVSEYPWPNRFIQADWNSFEIQYDDLLGIRSTKLTCINRDEFYSRLKDNDWDSIAQGEGNNIPYYVAQTHGTGYVVSPVPDKEYTLKYRYWINPYDLNAHGDQTLIPQRFDYVILAGALYHMYLFRDNETRTALSKQKFNDGLKDMRLTLMEHPKQATDTRVGRKYGY